MFMAIFRGSVEWTDEHGVTDGVLKAMYNEMRLFIRKHWSKFEYCLGMRILSMRH
jgi:hypothetical protein